MRARRAKTTRTTKQRKPRREPLDVASALAVAEIFWPEFGQDSGTTFVKRRGAPNVEGFVDLVAAEGFGSRTNVLDLFAHDAQLWHEPWWNSRHPDFARACRLGEIMCETWAAKLRRDFPEEDYAVFCTRDDNPIVRFHKIRAPDDLYYDPLRFPPGTVLMIRSRDGRRTGGIEPPRSSRPKRKTAGKRVRSGDPLRSRSAGRKDRSDRPRIRGRLLAPRLTFRPSNWLCARHASCVGGTATRLHRSSKQSEGRPEQPFSTRNFSPRTPPHSPSRPTRATSPRLVLCSVRPSGHRSSDACRWPSSLAAAISPAVLMALKRTRLWLGGH